MGGGRKLSRAAARTGVLNESKNNKYITRRRHGG